MAIIERDSESASDGLYRWDTDRYIDIDDYQEGMVAYFSCEGDTTSYGAPILSTNESNEHKALIPDALLARGEQLICALSVNGSTVSVKRYNVRPRPKPDDYDAEPTDDGGDLK